eukprot:403352880
MLEIIGHLFILIPLLTQVKHLPIHGILRFTLASAILAAVSYYQVNIFLTRERQENLYNIMKVSPRGFDQNKVKSNYRQLSRHLHPDKNPDPNAAEMFRQLTLANEILQSSEKRIAYDIFGQTDFSQEERILNQLQSQFKDEKMRTEQFRLYQTGVRTIAIFLDVFPFYFTWLILTIVFLKDDRRKAKILLMVWCISQGAAETFTRLHYGDPDYVWLFTPILEVFPQHFTVSENLYFSRYLFPLIFQLIVLLMDYSLDSVDPNTQLSNKDQVYENILKRQKQIMAQIDAFKNKQHKSVDEFKVLYSELNDMARKEGNDFIPAIQEEADAEQSWSFAKLVRTILGILMMVSLFQLVFLGGPQAPQPPRQ